MMMTVTSYVMQGQPLQALFARAQELFAQAESGSEPAAAEAANVLGQCTVAVDRLALFSGYMQLCLDYMSH